MISTHVDHERKHVLTPLSSVGHL